MPTSKALQHAQKLHQQGQLDAALTAYLALTREAPNHVEPWQLATLVYVQLGKLPEAEALLKQAISALPEEASLYNSLGNVLSRTQAYSAAIKAYQQALSLQPAYPGALTNLGNVYAHEADWETAQTYYQQALQVDEEYPDAHFNLGRALIQLNQWERAEHHLQRTLAIIPQHAAALGQLAELALHRGQFDQAATLLEQRVTLQPNHAGAWQSLGLAQLKREHIAAAVDAFQSALALDPTLPELQYQLATAYFAKGDRDAALQHYLRQLEHGLHHDSCYNLGVILADKQRDDDAIGYFEQALLLNPAHGATHLNLGAIYLKKNAVSQAIAHYEQALALDPGNSELQHILQALNANETPANAPTAYAEHLFDHYAAVYDQHLTEQLKYQAPRSLFDRVASALYPAPHSLVILDLGCGTGLAGALFAPYAKRLIGVDISHNMLEMARAKQLYHELSALPLETALAQQKDIDLIIAADVFPYIGDLQEVLKLAYQALVSGGIMAFTTEKTSGSGYVLQKSIRYAHSASYLSSVAHQCGFTVIDQASVVLRQQYQKPLEGWLFLLRKP